MSFKLALITGASSGIGKEFANVLSKKKIPLILTGKDPVKLEKIASELSSPVEILSLDLALNRKALIDLIREKGPDLIINNAGFGLYGEATDHATKSQIDMLKVNSEALLEISIEAAKALLQKKQPGVIFNVSSIASQFTCPFFSVYAASKAFTTSFSQSFDAEMKKHGIRVLVSLPGQVETSFANKSLFRKIQPKSLLESSNDEKSCRAHDETDRKKKKDLHHRLEKCPFPFSFAPFPKSLSRGQAHEEPFEKGTVDPGSQKAKMKRTQSNSSGNLWLISSLERVSSCRKALFAALSIK